MNKYSSMFFYRVLYFELILLVLWLRCLSTLRLTGVWSTEDVYIFLAKFSFQKTQVDDIETTRGYIYGNVTLNKHSFNTSTDIPHSTLVVVDGELISDLYGNASHSLKVFGNVSDGLHQSVWEAETARCRAMFFRIGKLAWNRKCNLAAKMDFLRKIPCQENSLCVEEDDQTTVIPKSQFTFTIQDRRQPRYWYISLVACWWNETSCEWETTRIPRSDAVHRDDRFCVFGPKAVNSSQKALCLPSSINYDIWMVNGVPRLRDYYIFEHQFSFEDHDILEIFLAFGVAYLLLGVFFHVKYRSGLEPQPLLLFAHIWLAFVGAALQSIHLAIFSANGQGVRILSSIGGVVSHSAQPLMLVLLLVSAQVGFPVFRCAGPRTCLPPSPHHSRRQPYRRLDSRHPLSCHQEGLQPRDHFGDQHTKLSQLDSLPKAPKPGCKCTPGAFGPWAYVAVMALGAVAIDLAFYIWALLDQDPVLDISVWNTTPGRLLVAARLAVSFYFLTVLRRSRSVDFLNFNHLIEPHHFAAGSLLWLLLLPVIVFISETSISPFWRKKSILSVTYLFDFLCSVFLVHLIDRLQ